MDTMKDLCARMAKEMGEAMVKALANQQPQQQPSKDKGWRQNTHHCWTCGCNATHHSDQCKRREEGHQEAATWENKPGGDTKRDWPRLKWVGPDNKTHNNKGDSQPARRPQHDA